MTITFSLNGRDITLDADADMRALDLIRETLGLTGTREGCGSGECGACTILVDGETRLSCLMLAAQLDGRTITTIEGFSGEGKRLHPVQEAFEKAGAVQCGFCTPGMVITVAGFMEKNPDASDSDIRNAISGNLCRCTGYQAIVEAARLSTRIALEDGE